MKKFFFMLGRICLSLLFICLVANQILNWDQIQEAFDKSVSDWIVHPGIPDQIQKVFSLLLAYSSLIMILTAVFAGIGGLLVLLGIKVRLGTILLILFLIPSTIVMHAFWMYDGSMREEQMMMFLRNISILGGLFILASSSEEKKVKAVGLFVLSWLIVAFGQPAWSPWLAPIAACIGYALFWKVAANIPFSKKRFWIATAWFSAVQLIQLSWMTSTDFQGFYILLVYLVVVFCLGIQFGLVTLFIDKIPLVATAALWTLLEWTRLFVLCGFSWNPVGLSLSAFILPMQAASLFGILGLSFLVILTNLAFWKKQRKVAIVLTVFPYLFGWIHTTLHQSKVDQSQTMTVGLVQTGLLPSQKIPIEGHFKEFIPPSKQWQRIVNLLKTCDQPLDLVVLPEFSVPNAAGYAVYPSSVVRNVFQDAFGSQQTDALNIEETIRVSNQFWVQTIGKIFKTDVIAGLEAEEGGLHFTSAFYCQHHEPKVQRYDKQILVPLAEYVPFEWVKALTRAYGITEFFTHGKESKVFAAKVPLSASICYEETFSHHMRQSRQKGSSMFVNLTNDNWYPNSKLPQQHFDHARLRAVENGVPMVRACNTGVTAAVDSLGRIIGQITEETRAGVLVAKVPLYHYSTLYSLWGDWGIVSLSALFLLICFYLGGFRFSKIK